MAGSELIPPLGDQARLAEFGALLPTEIDVKGSSYKASCQDVAISGKQHNPLIAEANKVCLLLPCA